MTTTTIKVSAETRDRLKRQAARTNRTLGEHLALLADAADRALRFEALRAAIAQTPPNELADYDAETGVWVSANLGKDV